MTYLELVNDVLVRLRESTVSTVGETIALLKQSQ
jgi:hypothetical protein